MSKSIPKLTENDLVRFWDKVDKKGPNDCWEWAGSIKNGYGLIRINGSEQAITIKRKELQIES